MSCFLIFNVGKRRRGIDRVLRGHSRVQQQSGGHQNLRNPPARKGSEDGEREAAWKAPPPALKSQGRPDRRVSVCTSPKSANYEGISTVPFSAPPRCPVCRGVRRLRHRRPAHLRRSRDGKDVFRSSLPSMCRTVLCNSCLESRQPFSFETLRFRHGRAVKKTIWQIVKWCVQCAV